jgi:hypothetical protein
MRHIGSVSSGIEGMEHRDLRLGTQPIAIGGSKKADIVRRCVEQYRQIPDTHLGLVERRVMSAVELCRTARLGELVQQ